MEIFHMYRLKTSSLTFHFYFYYSVFYEHNTYFILSSLKKKLLFFILPYHLNSLDRYKSVTDYHKSNRNKTDIYKSTRSDCKRVQSQQQPIMINRKYNINQYKSNQFVYIAQMLHKASVILLGKQQSSKFQKCFINCT